jgi:exopolyphosphatase/pppGpp-phosphohydrolase
MTDTFNLLIKDRESGEVLFNDKISVRLAEGGITENYISAAAFERGQAAIASHLETIDSLGADETYVMATSAIRSAPAPRARWQRNSPRPR